MLTPSDIESKTFHTSLRGYDLDEVDDFLDEIVSTIKGLEEQVAKATSAAGSSGASTIDEGAVGRALIAAQTAADEIVADAKAEAEKILDEARADAESWTVERDQKKAAASEEMAALSQLVAGVRTQLAVLATEVADRLDEMDQALASDSASTTPEPSDAESHAYEDSEAVDNTDETEEGIEASSEDSDEEPDDDGGPEDDEGDRFDLDDEELD